MTAPSFIPETYNKADLIAAIEDMGYAIVEGMICPEFCDKMVPELELAIAKEAAFHGNTSYKDYGALLACPMYGGSFLELVDNSKLMEPFNWILGDTCIIYVYTSSSIPPGQKNYTGRIHVDRPHFIPGYIESLGCLILLSDFTEENGATYVLPGSHKMAEPPEESYFFNHASRIIAPKGSVFYFNLRLWHSGGFNATNNWRHCVGMGMVRPYLKQRIDLPKALEKMDLSAVSDFALQKLGFFAQPPSSLQQYYTPKQGQGYRQRSEWESH
jgi:ectoine hydroxylase-related dioxygenase (phytanoyl-CoA dioxygenase family)